LGSLRSPEPTPPPRGSSPGFDFPSEYEVDVGDESSLVPTVATVQTMGEWSAPSHGEARRSSGTSSGDGDVGSSPAGSSSRDGHRGRVGDARCGRPRAPGGTRTARTTPGTASWASRRAPRASSPRSSKTKKTCRALTPRAEASGAAPVPRIGRRGVLDRQPGGFSLGGPGLAMAKSPTLTAPTPMSTGSSPPGYGRGAAESDRNWVRAAARGARADAIGITGSSFLTIPGGPPGASQKFGYVGALGAGPICRQGAPPGRSPSRGSPPGDPVGRGSPFEKHVLGELQLPGGLLVQVRHGDRGAEGGAAGCRSGS
jgi:hypothetical protein